MLKSILLVPVKLVAKAVLYVISAIVCAVAWIIGFPAMLLKNLLAVIGGVGIVALTIMLVLGAAPDTMNYVMYYAAFAGIILVPLIFVGIMKGFFNIRGFLLGAADKITLF